jgi:hypothetical protein
MKAAAAKATTGECRRGCRGKRNCQTDNSYRSRFLHDCYLPYG